MKIGVYFYSGTGVTRVYASLLRDEFASLGHESTMMDVTPADARRSVAPPAAFDGLVFGFPVYADFPPASHCAWIASLSGGGKPAASFATYGGRTSGYANYHASRLLRGAGFSFRIAAEFLGRHTFNAIGWNLAPDRPDDRDLDTARAFALLAAEAFSDSGHAGLRFQKPFGYDAALAAHESKKPSPERRWTNPFREGTCSLCGVCERNCPVGAMESGSGRSDPRLCEECLRCLADCPERALRADSRMKDAFPTFMEEFGMTADLVARKESKIIRTPLDAPA